MLSKIEYYTFSPYFASNYSEEPSERDNFLKLFDSLPEKIKDFLLSADTAERVAALGKTLNLDELDIETLALTVRKISAGELFIAKAPEFVSKKTGLKPQDAQDIFNQLLSKILASVIEEIKTVQRDTFINPVPRLRSLPTVGGAKPVPPAAPRRAAPQPRPTPQEASAKPAPKPVEPARPKQIANLGYLLQDEPTASEQGTNPNNVLDLRNRQK